MKQEKIVIAASHPDMLQGVRALLKDMFDMVFMVTNEGSLTRTVTGIQPDLIIADLSMPVVSGRNVARLLHRLDPELRFIILSSHDDQTVVDECLAAGAKGFVVKRLIILDLIPAVEAVLGGNTFMNPSVLRERRNTNDQSRRS